MQNKSAEFGNYDKSVILRALAGIGGGAAAGAAVDSEDRTRGALTGGAFGGLIHAPNLIGRAARLPITPFHDAAGDVIMEYPKIVGV